MARGGVKHQALWYIQDRLSDKAKASLSDQITLGELKNAIDDIQPSKSPGPDGLVLEFFRIYWDIIGLDYHRMILESISVGRFPNGVTAGMIALLHKGGERKLLTN
jgi:hypothetical protein